MVVLQQQDWQTDLRILMGCHQTHVLAERAMPLPMEMMLLAVLMMLMMLLKSSKLWIPQYLTEVHHQS